MVRRVEGADERRHGDESHRRRQVEGIKYQRLYSFESPAAGGGGAAGRGGGGAASGVDLTKPLYFGTYGERTKKEGISKVDPSKPGAQAWSMTTHGTLPESERRGRVRVHEANGDRLSELLRRQCGLQGRPSDHRRESAAEGIRVDERR
jgi:hypothetical protein